MPAPALASMAKKSGMSIDKAEKIWDMAKSQAAKQGHKEDFAYIMGIVKKAMKVESLISAVECGKDPKNIVQKLIEEKQVGINYISEDPIRTFFDEYGVLRFSTMDDILINHLSDKRLGELVNIANSLPFNSDLHEVFNSYTGTLEDLIDQIRLNYGYGL